MNSENQGNKPEQPSQNELDLGLDVEPIVPKKANPLRESFFNKAKSLFDGNRDSNKTQFHQRKEPTLGQFESLDSTDSNRVSAEKVYSPLTSNPEVVNHSADVEIENINQESNSSDCTDQPPKCSENTQNLMEENIKQNNQKDQEQQAYNNEEIPQVAPMSIKERLMQPENWKILQILPIKHRRLFITLLVIVLILIIIFSLKPSSDTVDAFEQQNSHEIPIQFQSMDQHSPLEPTIFDQNITQTIAEPSDLNSLLPGQEIAKSQEETTQAVNLEPMAVENPMPTTTATADKITEAKAVPQKIIIEEKPTTQTQGAKIVEAKPAKPKPVTVNNQAKQKTLTIEKGLSLMQVFRNNNLNIADVNAMTKAPGAGNVLSSFKPGDKIQVSVNAQGRVSELRLPNGAKFIRQNNGTYLYSGSRF